MEQTIHINVDGVRLEGILAVPSQPQGVILFAHGSGSSRLSPRNNAVAHGLQSGGLATLLIDLLTEEEDRDYETRFDIELLSHRLVSIIRWLKKHEETKHMPLGLFGASTGAAAALIAAKECGDEVKAVASRGGRPDLAKRILPALWVPVLLIVGGNDTDVLALNREAYDALTCKKDIKVIPGATHLFEEPGALDDVTRLTRDWFLANLTIRNPIIIQR